MPPSVLKSPSYNRTQLYLLVSDLVRAFMWFAVHMRFLILFPLTGTRFLPGGIADFYLGVGALSMFLELFEYASIFRHVTAKGVSKPKLFRLLLASTTRALVTILLLNYPKAAKNISFSFLVYSTSMVDLVRYIYNVYKVRTFGGTVFLLSLARRLTFTFVFPVQAASEATLLFLGVRLMETEYGYYSEYVDYDKWADTAANVVKVVIFLYLPAFYVVYKEKLADLWKSGLLKSSHAKAA